MDISTAISQWRGLLGESNVLVGESVLITYGPDASGAQRRIPVALRIIDSNSLQEIMRIAKLLMKTKLFL